MKYCKILTFLSMSLLVMSCKNTVKHYHKPSQYIKALAFEALNERVQDSWHFEPVKERKNNSHITMEMVQKMAEDAKNGKINESFKVVVRYIAQKIDFSDEEFSFFLMNWSDDARGVTFMTPLKPRVIFINTSFLQKEILSVDLLKLFNTMAHEWRI